MNIWAEKLTQKIPQRTEFGLKISSSCKGLCEGEYPVCSRAHTENARIEKEMKQHVN